MINNRISRIIFEGHSVIHRDLTFTSEDRKLAAALTRQEIVVIDELREGIRFSAKWSWVGVIGFSGFELQIRPKIANALGQENLALAAMLDFISDFHKVTILRPRRHNFSAEGLSLFELMITSFADACEEIVSRGILSDFVTTEAKLPALRGRLLLLKQLQGGLGHFNQIECEFDDQSTNICENKILLAALIACAPKVKDTALHSQIRRLVSVFEGAASLEEFDFNEAYALQRQNYNRVNGYYQNAHSLAAVIMAGLSLKDVFITGSQRCFSFVFKMYEVFEKFVTKLLSIELTPLNYRVHYQKEDSHILWDAQKNTSYTSLRPDILIENKARPGVFLPLDAKYKNFDVAEATDFSQKISTSDIYQTFAYAHGFGHGQHAIIPTSIILYPSLLQSAEIKRIHVRRRLDDTSSGQVVVVPINIERSLEAIKHGSQTKITDELMNTITNSLAEPAKSFF